MSKDPIGKLFGIPVYVDEDAPKGILELTQWDAEMDTGVVVAAINLETTELLPPEDFNPIAFRG